jgi:hypothetical protein
MRDDHKVRWAGAGSELWRVRVDLFAVDDDARRVTSVTESLRHLLTTRDDSAMPEHIGADQGTGIAGRPVVGLLFWVRADDVGIAARTAVETARRAAEGSGAGPELYDVTVIPEAAVALPHDSAYPPMPD